jgi:hypothetical protein
MHPRWPDPPALVDALLELTVVGSFSRIGPAVGGPPPQGGGARARHPGSDVR